MGYQCQHMSQPAAFIFRSSVSSKTQLHSKHLFTTISSKLSSLYSGLDLLVVLSSCCHFCLSFLAVSLITAFSLCSSSFCHLFTSHSAFFCSIITQHLSFSASLCFLFSSHLILLCSFSSAALILSSQSFLNTSNISSPVSPGSNFHVFCCFFFAFISGTLLFNS